MSAGENLMSVMVYIPTPFRRFAGNQTYVKAEGRTVGEVLDALGKSYPTLKHMIYNEADEIPGHINVYINSQEIHSLQGKNTPVSDGDESPHRRRRRPRRPGRALPRARGRRHNRHRRFRCG